tara:strand:- start:414 stop:1307 length:894 start_codon:yes stop_codon:yes gene_type:complete
MMKHMSISSMNLDTVLNQASQQLQQNGISNARHVAQILLRNCLDLDREEVLRSPKQLVRSGSVAKFYRAVSRRCHHEPVSRIIGFREFWSLPFKVTSAVLDPRSDSETVVAAALDFSEHRKYESLRVLDLGTGTGCLVMAFLSERHNATAIATDISVEALSVARSNAVSLGLAQRCTFVSANWCAGISDRFDVVLANPPYIPTAVIPTLEADVYRYDPHVAIDGGVDGGACYQQLIPLLSKVLRRGARVFLEIGVEQSELVTNILRANMLSVIEIRKDLSGNARCIVAEAETDKKKG